MLRELSKVVAMISDRKKKSLTSTIYRRFQAKKWEDRWRKEDSNFAWELHAHAPSVAHSLRSGWLVPGMEVLDIGCGLGFNAAWLAQHNFNVLAIDVSKTVIAKARRLHPTCENLEFLTLDVTARGKLQRQFDAVVDRGCFHGISPKLHRDYVRNLEFWLKPDGVALIMMASFGRSKDDLIRHFRVLFGSNMQIDGFETISMYRKKDGTTFDGFEIRLRRPS